MRTTIAIAALVLSCGATEPARVSVPRPVHNAKCPGTAPSPVPTGPVASPSGPGWAVALQLCAFRDGFGLCNPSGEPTGMTGFWQVSPAEVATVDAELSAFLRRQAMTEETVRRFEQYGRQVLGFFRGPRQYVFINAFPRGFGVTRQSAQTEVLAVCDNSWHVELDVATQQFANLVIDQGPRRE